MTAHFLAARWSLLGCLTILLAACQPTPPAPTLAFVDQPCPIHVPAGSRLRCGTVSVPENRQATDGRQVVLALLSSQLLFALSQRDQILFQLSLVFGGGLFLSYVYTRTRNLLIAVGAHALGNYPTIIFTYARLPWFVVNLTVMAITCLIVEAWRRWPLARRF